MNHRITRFKHRNQEWFWNGFWGFFFQPVSPSRRRERIIREGTPFTESCAKPRDLLSPEDTKKPHATLPLRASPCYTSRYPHTPMRREPITKKRAKEIIAFIARNNFRLAARQYRMSTGELCKLTRAYPDEYQRELEPYGKRLMPKRAHTKSGQRRKLTTFFPIVYTNQEETSDERSQPNKLFRTINRRHFRKATREETRFGHPWQHNRPPVVVPGSFLFYQGNEEWILIGWIDGRECGNGMLNITVAKPARAREIARHFDDEGLSAHYKLAKAPAEVYQDTVAQNRPELRYGSVIRDRTTNDLLGYHLVPSSYIVGALYLTVNQPYG